MPVACSSDSLPYLVIKYECKTAKYLNIHYKNPLQSTNRCLFYYTTSKKALHLIILRDCGLVCQDTVQSVLQLGQAKNETIYMYDSHNNEPTVTPFS